MKMPIIELSEKLKSANFIMVDNKFVGRFFVCSRLYELEDLLEFFETKQLVEVFYNRIVYSYTGLPVRSGFEGENRTLRITKGGLSFAGSVIDFNMLAGSFMWESKSAQTLGDVLVQIPENARTEVLHEILKWVEEKYGFNE